MPDSLFLTFFNSEPVIYGLVIVAGLLLMYIKFALGYYKSLFVDVAVFTTVFVLHGGTLTGGMAAAVAALVAGLLFPVIDYLRRS